MVGVVYFLSAVFLTDLSGTPNTLLLEQIARFKYWLGSSVSVLFFFFLLTEPIDNTKLEGKLKHTKTVTSVKHARNLQKSSVLVVSYIDDLIKILSKPRGSYVWWLNYRGISVITPISLRINHRKLLFSYRSWLWTTGYKILGSCFRYLCTFRKGYSGFISVQLLLALEIINADSCRIM